MRRTRMAAVVLLGALLTGCHSATDTADGTCNLDGLPREAGQTVDLIQSDGPFPYPRNDGSVFGNFEGLLPKHERGYYREYTVPTPGAKNRGARRIVTGGKPATDPPEYYYTGDHYESFCLIGGM